MSNNDSRRVTNNERHDARLLMEAQPGMKYTESLRKVRQGVVHSARSAMAMEGLTTTRDHLIEHLKDQGSLVGPGRTFDLSRFRGPVYDPLAAAHQKRLCIGRSETTSQDVTFDPFANLYVGGSAGSGATYALQGLAIDALRRGWQVRSIDAKSGEYLRLAEQHVPEAQDLFTALLANGGEERDAEFARHLLATEPGTLENPLLLVLDGGMAGQFTPYSDRPAPCEEYGWMEHLLRLMADPFTCVAIRLQLPTRSMLPPRVFAACGARLWMGRGPNHDLMLTFTQSVPEVEVEALARATEPTLNDRGWRSTPRGPGLFQAGRDTSAVAVRIPFWGSVA